MGHSGNSHLRVWVLHQSGGQTVGKTEDVSGVGDTDGMWGPKEAVMGPGCPLLPGSLCPLCNHCACWSLFPQLKTLKCALFVTTGSKTREGVVQGVASGTSSALPCPAVSHPPGLGSGWDSENGGGGGQGHPQGFLEGVLPGKAGPGALQERGYLHLLHPSPQIFSLMQWLRKPRSRHHIWEEPCSLGLGTLRQPQAW